MFFSPRRSAHKVTTTILKYSMMMGFVVFFINLSILLFGLTPTISSIAPPDYSVAKQGCVDRCGNISIPYPFGTITENCYQSLSFFVTCDETFYPPKLFSGNGSVNGALEITDISPNGQLKVLQHIASDCYAPNGTRLSKYAWANLPVQITVNNTANIFTIVGCDAYGYISGNQIHGNFTRGCATLCTLGDDLSEGSCPGIGCCQTLIPKNVTSVQVEVYNYNGNYTNQMGFGNCSYAFLLEESAFSFSPANLTNLKHDTLLPMVADWAIGNGTCKEAEMNPSTYACTSRNSRCYDPTNGFGYRCECEHGYRGSPYILDGCQDINECLESLHNCTHSCVNTEGSFNCTCPKGYNGDGKTGCSQVPRGESLIIKLVAGIALGVIGLLLTLICLYLGIKKRSSNRNKQKFFLQNGGILLQEKLIGKERSQDIMKIFSSFELQKATNDFHSSTIIGQGGFGTVYKGLLQDNNIVAIKKSKRVDPNQIEQFINEVVVLSQINHRNVVRLIGCCLETEVPLLVYEFIDSGTLSENIHNHTKACFLNWAMRLKIAAETAGVLSYLHSAASTPIIHRDVKSDNILLDHTFTAKVSDFGASRLVPLDQTQLSTMVQGTFGYLDPEYMQTNQLTEKSDVYSFGVVLLELLTGRKAISFDKPESEKNLANFFLSILKQDRLIQVLDDNIVNEGNMEQIVEVAKLAQGCLHVKGEDRPSMKEVAMELEGLRLGGKYLWARNEHNEEEMESLLGEGFNSFAFSGGNGSSFGYDDSLRDHVVLPISGGR